MSDTSIKKPTKHFKIEAVHKGNKCGFVKKVDYETKEVHLTSDKELALKYTDEDAVHYDIDFLTEYYFESGYVFTYI